MSLGAADTSVCATSGIAEPVWLTSISPADKLAGATSGFRSLGRQQRPHHVPKTSRAILSLILLASCATAMSAREEVSRDFQKSLPLTGGRSLKVEHAQGNIVIHTHSKGQVDIHASIKCSSDRVDDARQWCDGIKVLVDENSSGVSVRTQLPDSGFFHGRRNFSWAVNLDIDMPDTAPLEARSHFGSVTVVDLHAPAIVATNNGNVLFTGGRGKQRIENSFGNVEVARNDGDVTIVNSNGAVTASEITGALDVRDNFGEIKASNIGKRLDVNAGNGNVTVTDVTGPTVISDSFGKVTVRDTKADVTVRNENGAVEVTGVNGMADLHTSFGPIRFSRIAKGLTVRGQNSEITGDTVGGGAVVDTSFGGIDVRAVKGAARLTDQNGSVRASDVGGEIYAKTSFGGIAVEDAAGPITADNQSGSIAVRARAATRCQPIALTTSFGPIKVAVAKGAGYDVTARVSFGRISVEPSMVVSGQVGGESVNGKIGGGGCELKLNDQNGNIDIVN